MRLCQESFIVRSLTVHVGSMMGHLIFIKGYTVDLHHVKCMSWMSFPFWHLVEVSSLSLSEDLKF